MSMSVSFFKGSVSEVTPLIRKRLESAPSFNRWHHLAFFLIGTAAGMPPTSFLAPKQYFLYKLRTVNETHFDNGTATNTTQELNIIQTQYEGLATVVLSISMLLANVITVLIASKIRLIIRLLVPLALCLLLLILSLILTRVDTDHWQRGFFWITMLTIFFLTGSSVIVFSSIFGFASILPPSFLVVVLGGTAFGQVVTGILNILTLLIDNDPQNSALYFFSCATFIVLAAIVVTLLSFRSGPIHFYIKTLRSSRRPDLEPDEASNGFARVAKRASSIVHIVSNKEIIYYVMRKTWLMQLNAFLLHLTFGAMFPSLASAVEPAEKIPGDLWSNVLYTPTLAFMVGYLSQFFGRVLPRVYKFPSFKYWRWITLCTLLRVALIPLHIYCNVQPRSPDLPVIFAGDVWPTIFNFLNNFTSGYFGGVMTLHLPKLVSGELKENASIMGVLFLAVGQMVGGFLSVGIVRWIR